MSEMISRIVSPALLAFALAAWPGVAQEAEPPPPVETVGQHVVRPGDTLEDITAHYLGTSERWRENWRLNPGLQDPHVIRPGQTLKILVRELPEETARLARKSRRVEDKLDPREWLGALPNDLLLPLDEVQTYEGASAELEFPDQTKLYLTEETLVILGEEKPPQVPIVDRQLIEIEYGQADLAGISSPETLKIEIQLGEAALAKPRAAAEGAALRTRNRVREGVGQLMVYEGSSDLEAVGESVEVAEGMGSSVTPGEPPSPPEKLLEAPRALEPEAGSEWDSDPSFAWEAVPGARSYTLEVCRDPECGELVGRATGIAETSWSFPEPLLDEVKDAMGEFFWRVTATSASGLDGYPGSPRTYSRVEALPAFVPPRVVFRFHGPKVGVADRLVIGPGTVIEAEVEPTPDLKRWLPLFDGTEATSEGWRAPFSTGAHSVGVLAVDHHRRQAVAGSRSFLFDPDPPEIRWGEEDGAELGRRSGVAEEMKATASTRTKEPGYWARLRGTDASPLVWTSSKVRWLTMRYGEWEIASDKPFILVRARKKPISFPTLGVRVTREQGLRIQAVDPVCGVEKMSYQILISDDDREVLVIDTVDALGNRSRLAWPFEPASR